MLYIASNRYGEFSGGQKHWRHVIAADSVKTNGSAASDELIVRMGVTRIFV